MVKNILRVVGISFAAFSLGLGVQMVYAQQNSYQDPLCGPGSGAWPRCNVPPPINIGGGGQYKVGAFGANTFVNLGSSTLGLTAGVGIGAMPINGVKLFVNGLTSFRGNVTVDQGKLIIGDNPFSTYEFSVVGSGAFLRSGGLINEVEGLTIRPTPRGAEISALNGNYIGNLSIMPFQGAPWDGGNIDIKEYSEVGSVNIGTGGFVNLNVAGNINSTFRQVRSNDPVYQKTEVLRFSTLPHDQTPRLSDWDSIYSSNRMSCDSALERQDCIQTSYDTVINAPDERFDLFVEAGVGCPAPGPSTGDSNCLYTLAAQKFTKAIVQGGFVREGGTISGFEGVYSNRLVAQNIFEAKKAFVNNPETAPGTNVPLVVRSNEFGNGVYIESNRESGGSPMGILSLGVGGAAGGAVDDEDAFIGSSRNLHILPQSNSFNPDNKTVGIGTRPDPTGNYRLTVGGRARADEFCLGTDSATDCISSWSDLEDSVDLSSFISGSGISGRLTRFTGAKTVGNSIIRDNGTRVAIGTDTVGGDQDSLVVSGRIRLETFPGAAATAPSGIWFADGTFQGTAAQSNWSAQGDDLYRSPGNVYLGPSGDPSIELRARGGDIYLGNSTQGGNLFVRNRNLNNTIVLNGQDGSIVAGGNIVAYGGTVTAGVNVAAVQSVTANEGDISAAKGNVFATVGDVAAGRRVRSNQYCDLQGNNCFSPSGGSNQSLGQNGWQEMGDLLIQWGRITRDINSNVVEGAYPLNFPRAFSGQPYNVGCTIDVPGATPTTADVWCQVVSTQSSGATLFANVESGSSVFDGIYWTAFGPK